jgi:hypothetical protein
MKRVSIDTLKPGDAFMLSDRMHICVYLHSYFNSDFDIMRVEGNSIYTTVYLTHTGKLIVQKWIGLVTKI